VDVFPIVVSALAAVAKLALTGLEFFHFFSSLPLLCDTTIATF